MWRLINLGFFHPHFVARDVHEQVTCGIDAQVLGARQRKAQLRNVSARRDAQIVFDSVVVAINRHADSRSRACGYRTREMRHARMPFLRIVPDKIVALRPKPGFSLPAEAGAASHAQHQRAILNARGFRDPNRNFLTAQKDRQSLPSSNKLGLIVRLSDIWLKRHRNRKLRRVLTHGLGVVARSGSGVNRANRRPGIANRHASGSAILAGSLRANA